MPQVKYGSDLIVDLLKLYEIEYASLNPGSTFRGLHDSLVNYGGNKKPELIECTHEEIAVAMAHGYAKACGKPMVSILHNVVGLLHGAMAIYYAWLDRAPVIILGATGPMDASRRRPRIDWIHTAVLQGNAIRDYVKWDDQPFSADAVPDSFARAYRVALTEPQGPVYVCYDVGFQEDPLPHEVPLPNPERLAVPPPMQGDLDALQRAAAMLAEAEHPVVLTEYLGRAPKTVASLVELAELLALPVVDLNGRFNFPNTHPLCLTGTDVLERADVILALDVKDLYGPLTRLDRSTRRTEYRIPKGSRIIDLGLRDLDIQGWSQEFMKLQEVDLPILGDSAAAVPQLLAFCREALARRPARQEAVRQRFAAMKALHEATWQQWQEQARRDWDAQPMTTARLASEVWGVLQKEDWVLTANTLEDWCRRLWTFDRPYRHPGRSLGTATQIGIALGVALAHRGTGRLVVDIQPDGDLLFDASALWIATHHQIPLLVVMYNNRAYYNDWEHQIRIAKSRGTPEANAYIGMELDNPAPDFAGLARAFGWYAEGPILDGREVRPALERAIKVIKTEGRPALIDTVTQFR
ncbi:MAG: thiamine pyrophosphate-binding protein [Deltaproteobacteria bacterium]|nr:thiamine pyrophosphate-binding protein [Deltaproteobacteria bacterium]